MLAEIRQTFGRVVITHKTHEKEVERKARQSLLLTWTNLLVITITLGATLAAPLTEGNTAQLASIISATVAFGFGCVQLSFQPQRSAEEHRSCAKELLGIRDQYSALIADQRAGIITAEQLLMRRELLGIRLAELFAHAPQTSPKSYQKAEKALGGNEGLTFTDVEIDNMLPRELRNDTSHPPPPAQPRRCFGRR